MPLPLARSTSAHRALECPKLGDVLQIFDRFDSMQDKVRVRIAVRRCAEDGLQEYRILVQMLRGSRKEML